MNQSLSRTERAQMAMMLEVCTPIKPGNVDRRHDYPDTRLEHFLASMIFCRSALEQAEEGTGKIGMLINKACQLTSRQNGGNTHFGAFILLIPLVMGGTIEGAKECIRKTTVEDAIEFYTAFSHQKVRVHESDELDIRNPAVFDELRQRGMTLLQVMEHSADRDMVAREWICGFDLTRRAADLLHRYEKRGEAIQATFLDLLATEPDTFVMKKFGTECAYDLVNRAQRVKDQLGTLEELDTFCITEGINPGSLADITIAGIYVALGEGWRWDIQAC